MNQTNLKGKVALVTGGSRGIGAAIAKRLAQEGATVAITYVKGAQRAEEVVKEIENQRSKALAVCADNEDPQAVESAIQKVTQTFGNIDILVNNAGIFQKGPIENFTAEDFDRAMAINVRAAFVAIKAVLPVMPDGGRIISIGSNLALRASKSGLSLYTASKAALAGMTQALARELGPRGITVNIVHPGSTDTDMNPATGPNAIASKALMANPSYIEPSEIAAAVAFLASSEARSVTGAAWTIDNGANA